MDNSSIRLAGSEIEAARLVDGVLRVVFPRAYIVKTMTGSVERTLWWQRAELIFEQAELEAPLPAGAGVCDGGDVEENIYVYRDMVPIPLASRGRCRCDLRLRDSDDRILASAESVRLELFETPKYIEHLRD